MNRFFIDPQNIVDGRVTFPPDIAHQILHVLRLKNGDKVIVLNNAGVMFEVVLLDADDRKQVSGRITETLSADSPYDLELSLCFGLSHRDKVEWILQKGTEVGVSAFYPFVSSRTLIQSTKLSVNREERWRRIIREAAEQSGRMRLPEFYPPTIFEKCLVQAQEDHSVQFIAWEDAATSENSLRHSLQEFRGRAIALFVGPEGGFSLDEIDQAMDLGCKVVSLGNHILRMETAAIIFPALVLYELGKI